MTTIAPNDFTRLRATMAPRSAHGRRTQHDVIDPSETTRTFLLTDIEGSTRLWEHHRQRMAVALGPPHAAQV